mmetsp:Transcript_66392/g.172283  ORF Transcript_66392/g.172283 Transcript_66392/m.172283 type:complete len:461 (-) Transcript_66392:41-1423(-)
MFTMRTQQTTPSEATCATGAATGGSAAALGGGVRRLPSAPTLGEGQQYAAHGTAARRKDTRSVPASEAASKADGGAKSAAAADDPRRTSAIPGSRQDSRKKFAPPARASAHTSGSGLTSTTAPGSADSILTSSTPKAGRSGGKASAEMAMPLKEAHPPSERMTPKKTSSARTPPEASGHHANHEEVTPSRSTRRRSISEVEPPLTPPSRQQRKFRRPPQVPPLDFSFLHKQQSKDAESHGKKWQEHKAIASSTKPPASEASTVQTGYSKMPPGFSSASPEDQQRIAAFYGYRDDGFVATMHGLRTDEIRPRLYLGTMADAAYWPLLKALSVTHVLNCAVEAQKTRSPYEPHGIKYMLLPLHDTSETASLMCKQKFRALREATKFINGCLKGKSQRHGVFVHCVQGLSRSAAIVCAYLMEYEGLSMDRALAEVRTRHKGCLTSHHWQAMLYKFNSELLGNS